MNKNPFSLFDFLGYAIPGSVVLIFIWLFFNGDMSSPFALLEMHTDLLNIISFDNFLILIIISYIIGHFVSYLSSLTVERFALWHYGYPSRYLLRSSKKLKSNCSVFFTKKDKIGKTIWKVVVAIILLPITILNFIFGQCFQLSSFVLNNMDSYMRDSLEMKRLSLWKKLNLSLFNKSINETDFFRIISHYVYGRNEMKSKKMDNYVALYGFLRAITFIFNIFFMVHFVHLILHMPNINVVTLNLSGYLLALIFFGLTTYVFFLGYLKFYRRFTLECFMVLIADEALTNAEHKSDAI